VATLHHRQRFVEGMNMERIDKSTAAIRAYNRQEWAREAYDYSCEALTDGHIGTAFELQRDAARLYREAQVYARLCY